MLTKDSIISSFLAYEKKPLFSLLISSLLGTSTLVAQSIDHQSKRTETWLISETEMDPSSSPLMMFGGEEEETSAASDRSSTISRGEQRGAGGGPSSQVARGAAVAVLGEEDINTILRNEICENIYTACLAHVAAMSLDPIPTAWTAAEEQARDRYDKARGRGQTPVSLFTKNLFRGRIEAAATAWHDASDADIAVIRSVYETSIMISYDQKLAKYNTSKEKWRTAVIAYQQVTDEDAIRGAERWTPKFSQVVKL